MVLVFLGIFTPLNPVLFIALGLVFIIAGKNISKNIGEENIEEEVQQAETEAEEIRKPENVVSLLQVDPIELEFGYGIIPLADVNQGGDLLDRVVMIRRQIALELGTVVPIIRLRDNIQLNPNQYIIKIKGVQVKRKEKFFFFLPISVIQMAGRWKDGSNVGIPVISSSTYPGFIAM